MNVILKMRGILSTSLPATREEYYELKKAGSYSFLTDEPSGDVTCAIWNSTSERERFMYAVGYSVGATYAAATAGPPLP